MFSFKKRRNILQGRRYRVERLFSRKKRPLFNLQGIFQFKIVKIINLILLAGILGCLYFFIFSDFYLINSIEISGNQIISSDDILDITNNYLDTKKYLIFKNRNIFLLNRKDLQKKISEVVLLDELKIEKLLPNAIKIHIKEKNVALKWIANGEEYLIDKQGIIIKRFYKLTTPKIFQLNEATEVVPNQEEQGLLKIKNLSTEQPNLGNQVLTPANIEFIFDLKDKLASRDYLAVKEYTVPNNLPPYLTIELNSGGKVMFNLADTPENQVNRLVLLIEQKIKKPNLIGLDYIDLRLGESVYYKMK